MNTSISICQRRSSINASARGRKGLRITCRRLVLARYNGDSRNAVPLLHSRRQRSARAMNMQEPAGDERVEAGAGVVARTRERASVLTLITSDKRARSCEAIDRSAIVERSQPRTSPRATRAKLSSLSLSLFLCLSVSSSGNTARGRVPEIARVSRRTPRGRGRTKPVGR